MALIKCFECGNEFSEFAKACPKCGVPTEKVVEYIKKDVEKIKDNCSEENYHYIHNRKIENQNELCEEKDGNVVKNNEKLDTQIKSKKEKPQIGILRSIVDVIFIFFIMIMFTGAIALKNPITGILYILDVFALIPSNAFLNIWIKITKNKKTLLVRGVTTVLIFIISTILLFAL